MNTDWSSVVKIYQHICDFGTLKSRLSSQNPYAAYSLADTTLEYDDTDLRLKGSYFTFKLWGNISFHLTNKEELFKLEDACNFVCLSENSRFVKEANIFRINYIRAQW